MSGMDTRAGDRLEEARQGLIARTAAAERRNRPTTMAVLGGVAAVVALGYTGWQFSTRLSVRAQLEAREARAARLGELLGQVEALRLPGEPDGAGSAAGADPLRRAPEQAQLLEDLAKELGFKNNRFGTLPENAAAGTPFERNQFTINYTEEPTERVLQLLLRGPGVIEGMQVRDVTMRLGNGTERQEQTWSGRVTFSRWQRRSPG